MKILQRPYSGKTDQQEMMLLARLCQAVTIHVIDLPYRLSSWALDDPGNVALWVDEDGVLKAWAVLQKPFWTLDYVVHPAGGAGLHQAILAWMDHRAEAIRGSGYALPCW